MDKDTTEIIELLKNAINLNEEKRDLQFKALQSDLKVIRRKLNELLDIEDTDNDFIDDDED